MDTLVQEAVEENSEQENDPLEVGPVTIIGFCHEECLRHVEMQGRDNDNATQSECDREQKLYNETPCLIQKRSSHKVQEDGGAFHNDKGCHNLRSIQFTEKQHHR